MKEHRWAIFFSLLVILIFGLGFIVVHNLIRTSPNIARFFGQPLPVKVCRAIEADPVSVLGANGSVYPMKMVNLATELLQSNIRSPIASIDVHVGDYVAKGQPVIHFDPKPAKAQMQIAKASEQNAAIQLSYAKYILVQAKEAYKKGLAKSIDYASRSALAQARDNLHRARLYLKRIEAIHNQGLLSLYSVEQAQATVDKDYATFRSAQEQRLEAMKDQLKILEDAQSGYAKAEGTYEDSVNQLAVAQNNYNHSIIVSPLNGIVMERYVNAGDTPNLGTYLMTIGQINNVLVEAQFSETHIRNLHVGENAKVTLNSFPSHTFEGNIVRIQPLTDTKTRTFTVYVKVPNSAHKLKPGLSAFVRIYKKEKALLIPSVCLLEPTGPHNSSVFVVGKDNVARLTPVKVGTSSHQMTEIVSGLSAKAEVVVIGQYYLRDGDKVRIDKTWDEGAR